MVARNTLLQAPPYPVENALKQLGANLKTARIRRNLTVQEVAQKIGTGVRAIYDAEKGKLRN
jgi:DNA-binding XRE family transcriptional regulator